MLIGDGRLRLRILAIVTACILSLPAAGAPALASDEPPATSTFNVTRGGVSFQRTTFATELAPDGRLMRAGSFLVKFREHSGHFDRADAHRLARALRIDPLSSADAVRVQIGRSGSLSALMAYRAHPAVERIEPDYVARVVETPTDTRFAEQWGMSKIRAGVTGSTEPTAWDISRSAATTRIAVLDCGVYNEHSSSYAAPDGLAGHPDLRGKVAAVDNKNFSSAPDSDDYCNHGTHVAGIAAANTNNAQGVAGVGYLASIVNVKVLGDDGAGSFAWIINGILWAAGCENPTCVPARADIINLSLGATGPCTASLQAAIDKAWNQGLVIVAAAGNAGANGAITPANCNRVVAVAASDQNDARASFSNFGSNVDVAAPGVAILSTDYVGGYSSFNGTSMASPHVAGLAALVWNTTHNRATAGSESGAAISANQAVVNRITCTANENRLAGSTSGRIDAYAAVVDGPCLPAPRTPSLAIDNVSAPEGSSGSSSFTFTVSRSDAAGQTSTVSYATSNGTASSASDYTAASGSLTFAAGETTKTITVLVAGDTTRESNETFNVNLTSPVNATIADAQGVGTILNDDLPAMTITDVSQNERDSGTRTFSFTVRLSAAATEAVTVAFATGDETASGGTTCSGFDYLTRSGTLSFSIGTTSRTLSVSVCGDRANESTERFSVTLSNAVNATIEDGVGTGTIRNDD